MNIKVLQELIFATLECKIVGMRGWMFVAILGMILLSCRSSSTSPDGDTGGTGGDTGTVDITGTWMGSWESTTGVNPSCDRDTLIVSIPSVDQTGNFTADVDGGCGGQFSADGQISGNTLNLSGTASFGTITYSGEVNATGDSMWGTWELRDPQSNNVIDQGNWYLSR